MHLTRMRSSVRRQQLLFKNTVGDPVMDKLNIIYKNMFKQEAHLALEIGRIEEMGLKKEREEEEQILEELYAQLPENLRKQSQNGAKRSQDKRRSGMRIAESGEGKGRGGRSNWLNIRKSITMENELYMNSLGSPSSPVDIARSTTLEGGEETKSPPQPRSSLGGTTFVDVLAQAAKAKGLEQVASLGDAGKLRSPSPLELKINGAQEGASQGSPNKPVLVPLDAGEGGVGEAGDGGGMSGTLDLGDVVMPTIVHQHLEPGELQGQRTEEKAGEAEDGAVSESETPYPDPSPKSGGGSVDRGSFGSGGDGEGGGGSSDGGRPARVSFADVLDQAKAKLAPGQEGNQPEASVAPKGDGVAAHALHSDTESDHSDSEPIPQMRRPVAKKRRASLRGSVVATSDGGGGGGVSQAARMDAMMNKVSSDLYHRTTRVPTSPLPSPLPPLTSRCYWRQF